MTALSAGKLRGMRRLRALTAMHGRPWNESPPLLDDAGFDFPERYGGMA